jgi:hypothetical protein
MSKRSWQAVVFLAGALSLVGCRKATSHAEGTGYGAGLARRALVIGGGFRGSTTEGVLAPSERDIGRIKPPQAGGSDQVPATALPLRVGP